jgi:hypothetical protein
MEMNWKGSNWKEGLELLRKYVVKETEAELDVAFEVKNHLNNILEEKKFTIEQEEESIRDLLKDILPPDEIYSSVVMNKLLITIGARETIHEWDEEFGPILSIIEKIEGLKDMNLDGETTRKLGELEEYYKKFVRKVCDTKPPSERWKLFHQKAEMIDDEGRNYRISQEMARNIMSIVELGYNAPKDEEDGKKEGNNAILGLNTCISRDVPSQKILIQQRRGPSIF